MRRLVTAMEPEELTGLALEAAVGAGAGYADARWVREETEGLTVTDDRVDDLEAEESRGVGVRALVDGRWGFAASADPSASSVSRSGSIALLRARREGRCYPWPRRDGRRPEKPGRLLLPRVPPLAGACLPGSGADHPPLEPRRHQQQGEEHDREQGDHGEHQQ